MTPDDYLEALLDGKLDADVELEKTDLEKQEKEAVWLEDVDKLVEEHETEAKRTVDLNNLPDDPEPNYSDVADIYYVSYNLEPKTWKTTIKCNNNC
jgi:hypothetical protein